MRRYTYFFVADTGKIINVLQSNSDKIWEENNHIDMENNHIDMEIVKIWEIKNRGEAKKISRLLAGGQIFSCFSNEDKC